LNQHSLRRRSYSPLGSPMPSPPKLFTHSICCFITNVKNFFTAFARDIYNCPSGHL